MKRMTALTKVLSLLRPYRGHVLVAIVLVLLPAYFTVWTPYLFGMLIDEGLMLKNWPVTLQLALAVLAIKIMLFLLNAFVTYSLSLLGLQILVDFRDQLLRKVLSYPISFFDKMSSGRLTTRLTSDVNAVQELFTTALVPLIGNSFMLAGVTVAMLVLNWKLALLSMSIIPVMVWLTVIFHVRIRRRFGFQRQALSSMNSYAADILSGARDVRNLSALSSVQSGFTGHSRRLAKRFTQAVREYALLNPAVPFVMAVMEVLVLGFGGWMVYRGSMTMGQVVAFLGYVTYFNWPIRDFSEKYSVFQQAMASVDRLLEISDLEGEVDEGRREISGPINVSFRNVGLTYQGTQRPALQNVSFDVRAGQRVALIGETGSGKTSTCSLLMRFYEPTEGRIEINGADLKDYSRQTLRSQLGWVSQDVFLFSMSLRENLAFYSNVDDSEIWKVLELVQLKSWASRLPNGLDEVLAERAAHLSSGQRQLLSLARALLRKPRLLIFDEATAYIDSNTEWQIQRALEGLWNSPEFSDMTVFVIAHRLSTVRRCDQMLVYRAGEIVEKGGFDELMALQGYAARLFEENFDYSGAGNTALADVK
jgi:ATP-binding cassette subfamily B multidrug efflux pump